MSSVSGIERRQFGRKVTSIAAQAIPAGRAGVACTIKNISQNGALLEFSRPFTARGPFRLLADNNKLDVQCQIRHQDENGVGVEFIAITVQKLCVPSGLSENSAPRYEAAPKPELIATNGLELRARLFRAPDKTAPAVVTPIPEDAIAPKDASVVTDAAGAVSGSIPAEASAV